MKKLAILLIVIGTLVLLLTVYKDLSYKPIRQALTIEEALDFCKQESWAIISSKDVSGGREFIFYNGKYSGDYVNVIGFNPRKQLSSVFWWNSDMKILVRISDLKKVDIRDRLIPINYQIKIDRWELVAPIKRDYTYTKHGRIFYPQSYIDEYDLIHGDYMVHD